MLGATAEPRDPRDNGYVDLQTHNLSRALE